MERIFANELKKQLKHRIKGDIYTHIVEDTLIIDISAYGCNWHYTIYNLAIQLSSGLSSRTVAYAIVKLYKKYIISKYFY